LTLFKVCRYDIKSDDILGAVSKVFKKKKIDKMINLAFRKENKNIAYVQFCNIKQQIETTNMLL
jgi:hypothetical protein